MKVPSQRVILITGASTGIGRVCASHLDQLGYRVYGTTRNFTSKEEVERSYKEHNPQLSYTLIPMDVTDDQSVKDGIETILSKEGRIDVVVNNAGISIAGPLEETSLDEAKDQFETNFFGILRVCRSVLPSMRRRQTGYIVNVGSIAGLIGLPYQGIYSATKFALEGFTEALRIEVMPFNIRVVILEPGDFCTSLTIRRKRTQTFTNTSEYASNTNHALSVMEMDEKKAPTPEKIAYLLEQIICNPSPKLRYPVGTVSERVIVGVRKILSDRLFQWAVMKYYKLS